MLTSPRAIIFDLGGTLVDFPDWDTDAPRRWALSYDYLVGVHPTASWPDRASYAAAMRAAELAHWERVEEEHWSGPPSSLLIDGFRRLGRRVDDTELTAALDGYARAVDGWAVVDPEAAGVLEELGARGYLLGLLSNTWWAAAWHNRDLAAHGLAPLLDEVVYTSDLPHSKPHPSVFHEVASRLGVEPGTCVMIGDRMVDDVSGALGAGMRGIWKATAQPFPRPAHITPMATITRLSELFPLLSLWGGT